MRKMIFLSLLCFLSLQAALAQKLPSWSKSASNAVCKIMTYGEDGSLKDNSNGVLVSSTGDVVTDFKILSGADSVVVMTKDGKKYQVKCVTGFDDIYDISRINVGIRKPSYIAPSQTGVEKGSEVYVVMYSNSKSPSVAKGTVREVSSARDGDRYYTLDISLPESARSCPVLSPEGVLIGIVQLSGTDGEAYACGARMTESMSFDAFMFTNQITSSVKLMKRLPLLENDAQVAIMMGMASMKEEEYLKYMDMYRSMFPDSPYSYESLAKYYSDKNPELAIENIEEAGKLYENEDEQHYAIAKFIYTNNDVLKGAEGYDLSRACMEINRAININPLPLYYQLRGEIEMMGEKYDDARNSIEKVLNSNLCTYDAVADYITLNAKCGADNKSQLALIDSLMTVKKDILGADTLNLIYTKAIYLEDEGQYSEALRNLNMYSAAYNESMTAEFFYYREQIAMRGKRYQQAMNDILKARELDPDNLVYMVEHAGLCIIAGKYEEALVLLEKCLEKEPDNMDINRLTGLAMLQVGRNEEACTYLTKASSAGDSTAQRLLEMYCNKN